MLDIAKFNNNALNKNVDMIAGRMHWIGGLLYDMTWTWLNFFKHKKKKKTKLKQ
jgi:hypothetical protein